VANQTGRVRLRNIVVNGSKVVLVFKDDEDHFHDKTYSGKTFLEVLNHIASPNSRQRAEGLQLMKMTTSGRIYSLVMDDEFVGDLGDTNGPSGCNDVLLALHEGTPRPRRLVPVIECEGKLNVPVNFR